MCKNRWQRRESVKSSLLRIRRRRLCITSLTGACAANFLAALANLRSRRCGLTTGCGGTAWALQSKRCRSDGKTACPSAAGVANCSSPFCAPVRSPPWYRWVSDCLGFASPASHLASLLVSVLQPQKSALRRMKPGRFPFCGKLRALAASQHQPATLPTRKSRTRLVLRHFGRQRFTVYCSLDTGR